MIIKPALAALLLCTTAPAWAFCSYPLDATHAEVAQLGPNYTGVPVINGQTMEFPLVQTTGVSVYGAASDTGMQAIQEGATTGQPAGDQALPASGIIHVRMRLNSYPWAPLAGPYSTVWQAVGMQTGNVSTPLPKDSLQLSVVAVNSTAAGAQNGEQTFLMVTGQAISGSYVGTTYSTLALPTPIPTDVIGFWVNMDTRQMGVSVHVADGSAVGLAPGDYDLDPLSDSQGNPFLVPAGVDAVSLLMVGLLKDILPSDPLIGTPISATLEGDFCGNTGPAPVTLPNNKLFKGKPPILPPGLARRMGLPVVLPPAQ